MKTASGTLAAPFPYFGGKSGACEAVWSAFGEIDNYVEAFAGSAAMLLGALALTPERPLFGHKSGKQQKTHWVTFMKPSAETVKP